MLPEALASWSPPPRQRAEAQAFVRAVGNRVRAHQRIVAELVRDHRRVLAVPEALGLDAGDRLTVLAALAEPLRAALRAW